MQLLASVAWCLASGLAASLAFPPQSLVWLPWLSLVPWLWTLRRAPVWEAVR